VRGAAALRVAHHHDVAMQVEVDSLLIGRQIFQLIRRGGGVSVEFNVQRPTIRSGTLSAVTAYSIAAHVPRCSGTR
jgi:hypothetical protein